MTPGHVAFTWVWAESPDYGSSAEVVEAQAPEVGTSVHSAAALDLLRR